MPPRRSPRSLRATRKPCVGREEQTSDLYGIIQSVVHVEWLSTALTVAIALAFTALVARAVTKVLRRVLSHDNSPLPSSSIFVNIARIVVWAVGVSVVLSSCFGIDVSAAITALGIGGIAISLGFQDTLSNLIGGVQVSITGLVEPGDYIEVGGRRGVVHDVTWRHTSLETLSGERVVVPNSVINKSSLTHLPPLTKVVVPLIVTTGGADLDAVAAKIVKAAGQAAQKVGGGMSQEPQVLFTEAMECGYRASLIVWVEDGDKHSLVKDAVVRVVAPYTMA